MTKTQQAPANEIKVGCCIKFHRQVTVHRVGSILSGMNGLARPPNRWLWA